VVAGTEGLLPVGEGAPRPFEGSEAEMAQPDGASSPTALKLRIQTLQNMRLDGYNMVISELDLEVRNAQQYFVSIYSETTVRPHE
jgi:hypothetical protein